MNSHTAYNVLINKESGSVRDLGEEALRTLLSESSLNIANLELLCAGDFSHKIPEFMNFENPILIGGGDGTILNCAKAFMEKQRSFGILPLGTMNLLARDLDIPVEIDQTVQAYAQGIMEKDIDVGVVNDSLFLCCVGLGTMPESAEFREQNRTQSASVLMPRLTVFVLKQMDRVNQRKIHLDVDNQAKTIHTSALVISNNQYGPQGDWQEDNFKRISLQDGELGIYSAAPVTFWQKLRLLLRLGLGDWRSDPVIREWSGKTVRLTTKNKQELLSLDGETKNFKTPLVFSIRPQSLSILLPQTQGAGS